MTELSDFDLRVRGELTRAIAELGHAPPNDALARRLGSSEEAVEGALGRLHDAHALLLHPHLCRPWVVHPFALSPGSCWVEAEGQGWWANCLYCAMGIAAALGRDADIDTRIGGEGEPVIVRIRDGEPMERDLLFHLSTPPRQWWDNIIFACSSFQPFHDQAGIDAWCERHALPRGAIVPLPDMCRFAADWYGDYLSAPWRKRSRSDTEAIFARHGFTGPFWSFDESAASPGDDG